MGCVEVLDHDHLKAGGTALARGDGGPGQKKLPDTIPTLPILSLDGVGVAEPVAIPAPEGSRIVHSHRVDAVNEVNMGSLVSRLLDSPLDLPSGTLKAANVVGKRRGRIGAREYVLIQVQPPDEVLILPCFPQTRELDIHSTIILKHIIALTEECCKPTNADMLTHFQLGNLVEFPRRDVTIVHTQDVALAFGNASAAESIIAPGGLVTGEGSTCDVGTVVDAGKLGKCAPAATDIQKRLSWLESELLTDDSHLIILHLLERLLTCGVGEDTGCVDHARSKEPRIMVIAAVVVGADLLLVLLTRVEEHVRGESEEDEMKNWPREGKARPVMSILHDVEYVTIELNITVQIHLIKCLHWDLVAASPSLPIFILLESDVVLDRVSGKLDLVVDARRIGRYHRPEADQNRQEEDQKEEDGRLETPTKAAGDEDWNTQ